MTKVMFICHGNICRSPMGEYVFKKLAADKGVSERFEVQSSAVSYEEIGNDVYPPARRELVRRGVPCPPRAARHIEEKDVKEFDLLLCMDGSNLERLFRAFPTAKEKTHLLGDYGLNGKDIADPWYTGDFVTTYEEIALCCANLLEELGARLNH